MNKENCALKLVDKNKMVVFDDKEGWYFEINYP